jgi:hypothetical protein
MNPLRVASSLLLALLTCVLQAQAATANEVEVRLFYAHSGTFSEPIAEAAELWNVVAGEQGVREPSTSTFVRVQVSESSTEHKPAGKVVLTITNLRTKLKSVQSRHLGAFGANGKQYVGFWLPSTGCAPLQVEAVVSSSGSKAIRNIPFHCGE